MEMISSNIDKRFTNHNFARWLLSHRRAIRNTNDPLTEEIDLIRQIARITNGMYVTQGLISGSIVPGSFISEFLRLGPLTLPQIKAIDLPASERALEATNDFLHGLVFTDMEELAEKKYLVYDGIRKSTNDIGDVGNLVGVDEYKNELVAFNGTDIDWAKVIKFDTEVREFTKQIDLLASYKITDTEYENAYAYINHLKVKADSLDALSKDLGRLPSVELIRQYEITFGPVLRAASGVEEITARGSTLPWTPEESTAAESYREKIYKASMMNSSEGDASLGDVLSIYENLLDPSATVVHTSGFINRPSDMSKIYDDLNDKKIKKVIPDTDSLLISMKPLEPIGEAAKNIESKFGPPSEHKNNLEKAIASKKKIVTFSAEANSTVSAMNEIHNCNSGALTIVKNLNQTTLLFKNMKDLKAKLDQFVMISDVSNFFLDNPTYLTEIINLSVYSKPGTRETVKAAQKGLLESDIFKTVNNFLTSAMSSFNVDSKLSQSTELAKHVIQDFPNIGMFQKSIVKHVTFFKCLHDIKKGDSIPNGIKTIEEFRKIDTKPIDGGILAVEDVSKATDDFGKLEDAVSALPRMKGSMPPEIEALNQFEKSSKHAITIGQATRGLIVMKTLLDHKPQFEVVKSHSQLVSDEVSSLKNLPAEDVKNLEKLKFIPIMFDELETWSNGVKLPDASKIKDHSGILKSAQSVTGVEDLKKIRDSVVVLENRVQDPAKKKSLKELTAALDTLNTVGLKLSNYKQHFGDSELTLEQLDLFFTKFARTLHPTTMVTVPSVSSQQITMESRPLIILTSSTMEAVPEGFVIPMYVYIIAGVASFVAIGSVFTCYMRKTCCFKPKKYVTNFDNKITELKVIPTGEKLKQLLEAAPPKTDITQSFKKIRVEKVIPKPVGKPVGNACDFSPKAKLEMYAKEEARKAEPEPVVAQNVLFEAGEKIFAQIHARLIDHQNKKIGDPSEKLEDGTLLHYAKHVLNEVQARIDEVIDPEIQKQNRNQISLIAASRVYLRPEFNTICFFNNSYLDCSRFVMPNSQRFFMTPTPTAYSNRNQIIRQTNDKFWFMLMQIDCGAVVKLCSVNELKGRELDDIYEVGYGVYYPRNVDQVYIKKLADGTKFSVTCKKVTIISDVLVQRTLVFRYYGNKLEKTDENNSNFMKLPSNRSTIDETKEAKNELTKDETMASTKITGDEEHVRKLKQNKIDDARKVKKAEEKQQFRGNLADTEIIYRTVEHFVFCGWPKNSTPRTTEEVLTVLDKIKNVRNVVVHCSDGVGRTGTFVAGALAVQTVNKKVEETQTPIIDLTHVVKEVRLCRNGAVKNEREVAFIDMLIADSGYWNKDEKEKGKQYHARYDRFQSSYLKILDPKVELEEEYPLDYTEKLKKKKKKQAEKKTIPITPPDDIGLDVTQESYLSPTQPDS